MAWVLGHADVVLHFEPGANYYVPVGRFWYLYERHLDDPEADEIAWAAATTRVYSDECYTDCVLSIVAQTHTRYWRAFPKGPHIEESLAAAIGRAEYAAQFCVNVSSGELTLGSNLGSLLAELTGSLDAVAAMGKGELLGQFAKIERECRSG